MLFLVFWFCWAENHCYLDQFTRNPVQKSEMTFIINKGKKKNVWGGININRAHWMCQALGQFFAYIVSYHKNSVKNACDRVREWHGHIYTTKCKIDS